MVSQFSATAATPLPHTGLPRLVLASASPARRRLLEKAGIQVAQYASQFDESTVRSFDPGEMVQTLAQSKAQVVVDRLEQSAALRREVLGTEGRSPLLVMGCDSVLLVHGEVYGKPGSAQEAIARWQRMRGKIGDLYTGHALIDTAQRRTLARTLVTRVHFAHPSDRQIAAYVATGEPLHCAGCFALEGKGGLFVDKIEGCHTNVIGLSMPLLRQMLDELGYDVTDFWTVGS